jgi:hypothetical protein
VHYTGFIKEVNNFEHKFLENYGSDIAAVGINESENTSSLVPNS